MYSWCFCLYSGNNIKCRPDIGVMRVFLYTVYTHGRRLHEHRLNRMHRVHTQTHTHTTFIVTNNKKVPILVLFKTCVCVCIFTLCVQTSGVCSLSTTSWCDLEVLLLSNMFWRDTYTLSTRLRLIFVCICACVCKKTRQTHTETVYVPKIFCGHNTQVPTVAPLLQHCVLFFVCWLVVGPQSYQCSHTLSVNRKQLKCSQSGADTVNYISILVWNSRQGKKSVFITKKQRKQWKKDDLKEVSCCCRKKKKIELKTL